ncbi:MAG: hypothetical protein K8J08_12970 [Thermoanaerobaculia bacterium]|nr:hypothetical protein [Thermoanaerobaculia bacterium]
MSTDAGPTAEVDSSDSWKQWEQAILASVKGVPKNWREALPTRRREGLEVEAVYPHGPKMDLPTLKERPGWETWLELPVTRPVEVLGRLAALADWPLEGVRLNVAEAAEGPNRWGVEEFSDLMTTWPGTLSLSLGDGFSSTFDGDLADLVELVTERLESVLPARPRVCLGLDPLGVALSAPSTAPDIETCLAPLVSPLRQQSSLAPFEVDTARVADRGADPALEVGYAVAAGVAYGRALMTAGWSPEEARDSIRLTVSLGRDVGIQIAKVRALRLAWRMLWTELGASPSTATCHGRSAWRTQTVYDVENNQIRATLEALAGVVGGCSSLSIRRFDAARSAGGDYSNAAARLTLATQAVLGEECGLKRVVDAAAGSAYLETMTELIARRGWQRFRSIEGAGGLSSAQGLASLVASLQVSSQQRRDALAEGQLPIVGVSAFPAESERLPSELAKVELSGLPPRSSLASSDPVRWRDSGPLEEERRRRELAGPEVSESSQGGVS